MADEWVTTAHARAILSCSPGYIYKLGRLGKIRSKRDGDRRLFYLGDVRSWLRRRVERAKWRKKHPAVSDQMTAQLPPVPEPESPVLVDHPDLLLLRHDILLLTGLIHTLLAALEKRPAA